DRRAGGFGQQVDRRRRADELSPAVEAPADFQPEPVAVEARRFLQVVDVDVDQKAHRGSQGIPSSAADGLGILPKPATKRASRVVILQKEKSASSKLIACFGKRSSQACLGPWEIRRASPRIVTRIKVNGSARPSSVSAMESATRGSCAMSCVCQARRL